MRPYFAASRHRVDPRRSISVAIAAPVEEVVDPHLHHLDVAVPHKESISSEALEPSGGNKCPVVEPQKIILHLRRPIGRESPLDARAHQPAWNGTAFSLWRLRSGLCCRPSIQYSGVAS